MKEPFIFLRSEVTREDALKIIDWLQDNEVRKYLSDNQDVSESIRQVIDRVNLPVLTHLFNNKGRFYLVHSRDNNPVGFVRLVTKGDETEMVIVIGDRKNWGQRFGTSAIHESMKIAFFELRSSKLVAKIHKKSKRSILAFLNAGFTIERESLYMKYFSITMNEYLRLVRRRAVLVSQIYITETDKFRLNELIVEELYMDKQMNIIIRDLKHEISRAKIVDSRNIPEDVITMNSRVLLCLNGNDMEISLVYPRDADESKSNLSILSHIGTAILGYREGDKIEWEIPSGTAEIFIKKILYQPEAAGDYHL
ncbi:MAG: nucleoside diphosphate kinase regulator [Clostridiaceae bacterium]|nr:nucleoside diphosphate kinase regulator [Clostridiaceae bacterium]